MLDENVGRLAGEHIPKHAAPDAGDHAEKYGKKPTVIACVHCRCDADRCEDAEPKRIGPKHQDLIQTILLEQFPAHKRQKDDHRAKNCRKRINRIAEHDWRKIAHQNIAQYAPAAGSHQPENADSENIHVLF